MPTDIYLKVSDSISLKNADIFNPAVNSRVAKKLTTRKQLREFLQELWRLNKDDFITHWKAHGTIPTRFINAFLDRAPEEVHWTLYNLQLSYHPEYVMLSQSINDEYFEVNCKANNSFNDNLAKVIKAATKFNEWFGVVDPGSKISKPAFSPGWHYTYIMWVTGHHKAYLTRTGDNVGIEYLVNLKQESSDFKLDLEVDNYGTDWALTLKVSSMLTYANRSELYKMYEYSTNVITTIGERPWKEKHEENYPLYGVELEVSTNYTVAQIIDAFPDLFAICKKDSSVTGNKLNPMEIVTIPATLRKHRRMWNAFFKNTNVEMFDNLDKHTNGMHIHVDRKAFDEDMFHQKKFLWFFGNPANTQFLKEIAERDDKSFASYTAVPAGSTKFTNSENAIRSANKNTIVNTAHSATLEVRLFKGIVSWAKVLFALEFVDSIVQYSFQKGHHEMTIPSYLRWLNSLPVSTYRVLRMCLGDLDVEAIVVESEIAHIIGTIKNAKDACERLNKLADKHSFSPSLLDKTVMRYNEMFDKDGWKMKRSGGKFIVEKSGTKFAKFDDQVSKMYSFIGKSI